MLKNINSQDLLTNFNILYQLQNYNHNSEIKTKWSKKKFFSTILFD